LGTVISNGKGLADQRTRQSAADLRVTEWGPFGANGGGSISHRYNWFLGKSGKLAEGALLTIDTIARKPIFWCFNTNPLFF